MKNDEDAKHAINILETIPETGGMSTFIGILLGVLSSFSVGLIGTLILYKDEYEDASSITVEKVKSDKEKVLSPLKGEIIELEKVIC